MVHVLEAEATAVQFPQVGHLLGNGAGVLRWEECDVLRGKGLSNLLSKPDILQLALCWLATNTDASPRKAEILAGGVPNLKFLTTASTLVLLGVRIGDHGKRLIPCCWRRARSSSSSRRAPFIGSLSTTCIVEAKFSYWKKNYKEVL